MRSNHLFLRSCMNIEIFANNHHLLRAKYDDRYEVSKDLIQSASEFHVGKFFYFFYISQSRHCKSSKTSTGEMKRYYYGKPIFIDDELCYFHNLIFYKLKQ